MKESLGEYVKKNYGKKGVSVYGVSALDGYHSMLLTCRVEGGVSRFMLVDQGPATSLLSGKSVFTMASALDETLSAYVKAKQGKRTAGGHEFPASIQIYKLFPGEK
jgi:hypothetical protein